MPPRYASPCSLSDVIGAERQTPGLRTGEDTLGAVAGPNGKCSGGMGNQRNDLLQKIAKRQKQMLVEIYIVRGQGESEKLCWFESQTVPEKGETLFFPWEGDNKFLVKERTWHFADSENPHLPRLSGPSSRMESIHGKSIIDPSKTRVVLKVQKLW